MISVPLELIPSHFPQIQAVYLFGSCAEGKESPDSDIDLALLLPPEDAKIAGNLSTTDLRFDLEKRLKREVDLVNLRRVSTVFQNEITTSGTRILCRDENEADVFEMLVLSKYQKLNEERAGILASLRESGKAYAV